MNSQHRMDDLLQRHRLGELPPHLEKKALEILATPEGRRRLEELVAEDERILRELPPRKMADAIRQRLESERHREPMPGRWVRAGWVAGSGLAVVLGGLAVVAWFRAPAGEPATGAVAISPASPRAVPETATHSLFAPKTASKPAVEETVAEAPISAAPTGTEGLRTKGDSHRLRIHRVGASGGVAIPLVDGDSARAGDILQVSLSAGPAAFAAVLSLDGTGLVTRHLPETGDSAVPVREEREAPHSFELDTTSGFERFVLVQADHSFPLHEVEIALRRAGGTTALHLPQGWTVQSILVRKREIRP